MKLKFCNRPRIPARRFLILIASFLLGTIICQAAPPPQQKIPILLDTDIGSDIDDAFAVALILRSPELDLLGVTTVSGDTQARARLAAKMLWEAGRRKIPVAAGEPGKPLPIEQTRWADGFKSEQLVRQSAVDFLKSRIEKRPGQLTIVAIGPLTNIGALLRKDPAIAKKIKRIVLMGGSIAWTYSGAGQPVAEYNIKMDAAAAQIVFSSGAPILMAPLDVTAMLQLSPEDMHRIFTQLTPTTNALTLLYHLWGHATPTLFDPMAVALVIDPTLCLLQSQAIEVDSNGFTRVVEGKPPNVTVALKTVAGRFMQFYLHRVAP
ncbi:MAG TPA: nucleoside hydrolase [Terriglobia bacterium]|nr:nucleoside hydrolase [Terriglobia bacterium]